MKKIYLVKKDPSANGKENWIVMNGQEFSEFIKSEEGQRRKKNFGILDACSDNDFVVVAECGSEEAKEWRSERNHHYYLKQFQNRSEEGGVLHLNESIGEDITLEDLIGDPAQNVEESVLIRVSRKEIQIAIMSLTQLEKLLIEKMFLADRPMSMSEFAQLVNRNKSYVQRLKKSAFLKLRKFLK